MTDIILVDDDLGLCRCLQMLFEKDAYSVSIAHTGAQAIALISDNDYGVVFTDLKLPDMSGLEVVAFAKKRLPVAEIVVITGYASIETAVDAIKSGAYDYLTKPLSIEKVRITLKRVMEKIALMQQVDLLRRQLQDSFSFSLQDAPAGFESMIGSSPGMQEIFKIIRQTAQGDSTVLITGESGTGKELVARAIHSLSSLTLNSQRSHGRFVAVNCAAFSRELAESELFGHVKGAFTGAIKEKTGFIEMASGGTLFLDEIGETTTEFQAKLLRVLQEGEYYKVGHTSASKMNARVISASNRNLEKAIAEGIFRKDLYYRLNVITIEIPPLRQRRQDIPILAYHFLKKYASRLTSKEVTDITPETIEILMQYDYPGNIRELENALEYAVTFTHGSQITPADLPASITSASRSHSGGATLPQGPLKTALYEYEKSLLTSALNHCSGNISMAARLLSISRQRMQQKIKEFDLNPP
ncbi:two component, sigma54 specific, transcriptional regulator, Fis family [Candidatus Magnetobacterium bavaricum]|uniref:Two component, sigma54 specific, transcriptional regulator, Fis family n=1 Tax=Candidatus Magnetobacterium bavaricum TaxID=29290 RepID=A0A0F3GK84_9BACT|nr:two component, sigma54 specific, transcriptional regulator, Fis family [Candidatus Magnetobacterium bavaricum]